MVDVALKVVETVPNLGFKKLTDNQRLKAAANQKTENQKKVNKETVNQNTSISNSSPSHFNYNA